MKEALRVRLKKGHAGPLARDHSIALTAIEEFVLTAE
jgi:hypothetical protein